MKFEVFNDKKNRKFWCESKACLPTISEITAMSKIGYKFKMDNKVISKTALINYIKGDKNEDTNKIS